MLIYRTSRTLDLDLGLGLDLGQILSQLIQCFGRPTFKHPVIFSSRPTNYVLYII